MNSMKRQKRYTKTEKSHRFDSRVHVREHKLSDGYVLIYSACTPNSFFETVSKARRCYAT